MKKILTDCDGVLLDWETSFHAWMKAKGYSQVRFGIYNLAEAYGIDKSEKRDFVREFNESAWMKDLPVFRDARSGVARLVEAGYTFECITSMSKDPYAKELRWENLQTHFGNDAFVNLICLDVGADKDEVLAEYAGTGSFWIEDKWENAIVGADYGLRSILMDHPHNKEHNDERIYRAQTWNEIADYIFSKDS